MKHFVPMILACLVLLVSACGQPEGLGLVANAPQGFAALNAERDLLRGRTGEFEGIASISFILQQRLLDPAEPVTRFFAIEQISGAGIYKISRVMGYQDESGEVNLFLYGEPNPFNTMLWHHQLSRLAREVGASCEQSSEKQGELSFVDEFINLSFRLKAEIRSLLPALCAQGQSLADEALTSLWLSVMSYDAPFSEELAWREFFQTTPASDLAPGSERVIAMFETMFLNPYFLLQK